MTSCLSTGPSFPWESSVTDHLPRRDRSVWTRPRAIAISTFLLVSGCASGSGGPGTATGRPATPPDPTASPSATAAASRGASESRTMAVPRAAHSATLLPSGQVLLAGGCIEDSCEGITASSETFDPARGVTVPGPSMVEPRVGHTAIGLRDGRVLLLGGFGSSTVTATTELYDPQRGAFVAGRAMSTPRAGALAFVLVDGTVLVVGGFDGRRALASAELFDPATGTFRVVASMATARSGPAGALLADGRVLVVGGRDGDRGAVHATAELYDPVTGAWARAGDLSTRRHKHAVVALADGRALVVGGSDERDGHGVYRSTELFDPVTGTFSRGPDLGEPRYKIVDAVVRMPDGAVLVAGGGRRAEVFDPIAGAFSAIGDDVGGSWSFATATVLSDGAVLVAGGYDARIAVTDRTFVYRPAARG